MSIDIRLLQCIADKSTFQKLSGCIPLDALEPETRILIADVKAYYEKFDHKHIDISTFMSWAVTFRHPNFTSEQRQLLATLIQKMTVAPPQEIKDNILSELHTLRLATVTANAVFQFNEGELEDFPDVLAGAVQQYKIDSGIKAESWIDDDINNILDEVQDNRGLHWRLESLNRCMRGLRPGDFGIIAARPDRGKTTFFASEVTHLAKQLPEDRNVIWLNNEGVGRRIVPRLYQAAIGCTLSELVQHKHEGTLLSAYIDVVGRPDRIRVYDIHGYSTGQVERLIENSSPGVVVADIIDHIRGTSYETRTDVQLEHLYKWFRECCVKHSFVGLASSQISAEGDGLQFPTLSMLKDSKTGKQGACDFQLMIGARNDEGWGMQRWLSLPKNKLRREGAPGDPRAQVLFEPDIARYSDACSDTTLY